MHLIYSNYLIPITINNIKKLCLNEYNIDWNIELHYKNCKEWKKDLKYLNNNNYNNNNISIGNNYNMNDNSLLIKIIQETQSHSMSQKNVLRIIYKYLKAGNSLT